MPVKYLCDGCEAELSANEYNYAAKQFNILTDEEVNLRIEVGPKVEGLVLCSKCLAVKLKTQADSLSKSSIEGLKIVEV